MTLQRYAVRTSRQQFFVVARGYKDAWAKARFAIKGTDERVLSVVLSEGLT